MFRLPLSIQADAQMTELEQIVEDLNCDGNSEDSWTYSWGNSRYSSRKSYNIRSGSEQASPLFSWLWTSGNLGKHKFSSGYSSETD
jgi:hypothetical protein